MHIRAYTPEDKSALLKLIDLNTPTYFDATERKYFEDYLTHETDLYFVLEIEDTILACGGINRNLTVNKAVISWDMVHPEHHGKGYGQALLSYRLDLIRIMEEIAIIQVRTSQLTYKFYEKSGFVLKTVGENFWGPGLHLYDMFQNN